MPDNIISEVTSIRPPQDNIPQTKQMREQLLDITRRYISQLKPVPPLSFPELQAHTTAVLNEAGMDYKYSDFAAVLINNEVWRETVAGIDFNKRLLLLPKCLRNAENCPAEFDDIGLLCENCGRCIIGEFKNQAEQLGYAVLVAEGSPVVMKLIETGQIEAVVGVSCLSVLERVFPYMEAGAVPGIAIPLLQDGCANTSVDVDWVWQAIYQSADDKSQRLNLDALHKQVQQWFTRDELTKLLSRHNNQTEAIAIDWMAKAGKRWRPFLVACAYRALSNDNDIADNENLRKAAVAVECFHKASLIHDDIEDGDKLRYGLQTVHEKYGVPIALNIGDFLLGQGYKILLEINIPNEQKALLAKAAAHGHIDLCIGQGSELLWAHQPRPLKVNEIIDIFMRKTSPAFEVALNFGAILAGCDLSICEVLKNYSRHLGIAYQIRDDLEELKDTDIQKILTANNFSILPALAYELAGQKDKKLLENVWCNTPTDAEIRHAQQFCRQLNIERCAGQMAQSYKSKAIGSLIELDNADLKGLLRRVIGKIFNDFEIMGCCNDNKKRHAQGSGRSKADTG